MHRPTLPAIDGIVESTTDNRSNCYTEFILFFEVLFVGQVRDLSSSSNMLYLLFSAAALCLTTIAALCGYTKHRRIDKTSSDHATRQLPVAEKDPYINIEPLQDFDWKSTPPIRNAPLKPKYHLTMAIEQIPLSDIIDMDNTYAERMQLRRQIMDENFDATVRCNPICTPAVLELHDWTFGTYLPQRFPTVYERQSHDTSRPQILNKVNNEHIPLHQSDPIQALWSLGAHVDTDFLLLLPSSTAVDGSPLYHLEAFTCCFPSGFSLREKLGLPLAEIHRPVPGYKQKLEKSMDRFFARLPCGKAVKRSNWAITTNSALFSEGGNHLYDSETGNANENEKLDSFSPHHASATSRPDHDTYKTDLLQAQISLQKAAVVIEECRLRSERQTLFRLPASKALVFSFKTYLYTLEEMKREGYAEILAQAVEGLGKGNVPQFEFYKRGVVWGGKVREYLRS